jgi:hypothetical protein
MWESWISPANRYPSCVCSDGTCRSRWLSCHHSVKPLEKSIRPNRWPSESHATLQVSVWFPKSSIGWTSLSAWRSMEKAFRRLSSLHVQDESWYFIQCTSMHSLKSASPKMEVCRFKSMGD